MSIKRTIGGDRLGSGKKMQAHLHNYYRSTHNLSENWASSMGSGILYPAMCKLAMRGDSFDIAIDADARTIPTLGPLFGSYKMQIDVFQCPIRLYQGLLHNNPLAIGLNMSKIKFPLLEIFTESKRKEDYKFSNSSLLKYLGMSGIGTPIPEEGQEEFEIATRYINAIPALAYYDIFKNYYANKQEEVGYVISPNSIVTKNAVWQIHGTETNLSGMYTWYATKEEGSGTTWNLPIDLNANAAAGLDTNIVLVVEREYLPLNTNPEFYINRLLENLYIDEVSTNFKTYVEGGYLTYDITKADEDPVTGNWSKLNVKIKLDTTNIVADYGSFIENKIVSNALLNTTEKITLKEFKLENIDDMRYKLLAHHTLGNPYIIDGTAKLPYGTLTDNVEVIEGREERYLSKNNYPENGLVLKTYQNDIFNNWLNAEWIEGENGIAELSKVEVVDGEFTMDALNFAQKLYNMLNRIAIAGATYEDWQDVVYEEVKRKQVESPIYCGGMSQEVYFDEIIQTAPADGDPLGTLGGRGRLKGDRKGGKLHIKCDEACFIIAIVSLTPRVYYTQGNEFYMTDVMSMDDLHKPAMDGIGFQDLIGERLAWWDTKIQLSEIKHRSKVGKLPSWIEYMTSVDKAYGDFAETEGKGYMILNRNYERDEETDGIKDATTYIDPAKYNYAFAYNELESQNFWVQIHFDIKARRLMSARIIPNV